VSAPIYTVVSYFLLQACALFLFYFQHSTTAVQPKGKGVQKYLNRWLPLTFFIVLHTHRQVRTVALTGNNVTPLFQNTILFYVALPKEVIA
jgi:hypothetical protein